MTPTIRISGVLYHMVRAHDDWEKADEPIAPLQQVMGFSIAEELYDQLPLKHQLILDLIMAGWNQSQIAKTLDVSQSTISLAHKSIRYTLANSKLKLLLEARVNGE